MGPVGVSGGFTRRKTGLFRACFFRRKWARMRSGLWRGWVKGKDIDGTGGGLTLTGAFAVQDFLTKFF